MWFVVTGRASQRTDTTMDPESDYKATSLGSSFKFSNHCMARSKRKRRAIAVVASELLSAILKYLSAVGARQLKALTTRRIFSPNVVL
jgi:hypothetical protein